MKKIILKNIFKSNDDLNRDSKLISLKKEIKELKNNYHQELSKIDKKDNRNKQIIKEKYKKDLLKINNEIKEYKKTFEYKKEENVKNRSFKDIFKSFNSFFFSFLTFGLLVWIISYILFTGSGKLTVNKIFGDYKSLTYSLKTNDDFVLSDDFNFDDLDLNNEFSSKKWGVSFKYLSIDDKNYISIDKMSKNSPFNNLVNVKDNIQFISSYEGLYIQSITLKDSSNYMFTVLGESSISSFIEEIDKGINIIDSTFIKEGGGFRGSLLNTLNLIGFSILFSFILGVGGAIYLGVYAKNNRLTKIIRSLIDMTSGIPSIIFGLAGALIFIPIANVIPNSNGGNIISGSLTMMMILLPTIVKTVEESIKAIPTNLTSASLALGASKTETVFKIILPNALPGILTSLLLSIGRIIGESAALVFAMGTTISEIASLNGSNASLAVHIWVILGGDHPSYDNACAISIVIVAIVLILTLLIKLISFRVNKFKVKG